MTSGKYPASFNITKEHFMPRNCCVCNEEFNKNEEIYVQEITIPIELKHTQGSEKIRAFVFFHKACAEKYYNLIPWSEKA